MKKKKEFIFIQEAHNQLVRRKLLQAIIEFNRTSEHKYFYSQDLKSDQSYRWTTIILSIHPVKFGQMKFEISEFGYDADGKTFFPYQAFCQFEIILNKKVNKVCIFNCHLRSSVDPNAYAIR